MYDNALQLLVGMGTFLGKLVSTLLFPEEAAELVGCCYQIAIRTEWVVVII